MRFSILKPTLISRELDGANDVDNRGLNHNFTLRWPTSIT